MAMAASVIIDGDIYVKAVVGTRKYGTNNWVTIEDKFLIGSCGKAFTATLAAAKRGRTRQGRAEPPR
jgi:CubicO group peptidase (beta-lactamase class C family)